MWSQTRFTGYNQSERGGNGKSAMLKETLHRVCASVRHCQGKAFVCARRDGGEGAGEREARVAKLRRALAALPPLMAGSDLVSDARCVLR